MDKYSGILTRMTGLLKDIGGVTAVALGGSRATGTETEHSDIDLGLYLEGELDVGALNALAREVDDEHRGGLVTEPGEWGPWINGGGWLTVQGVAVDLLYRDLGRLRAVVRDCLDGKITIDYQCGHPFGFLNGMYLGELHHCVALHERGGVLTGLKALTSPFPEPYRDAMVTRFLWEADFSLATGKKSVHRQDVLHAAGSLYRCVICLIQVLAAMNGIYLLNEKGSLRRLADGAAWLPHGFAADMERSLEDLRKESMESCFALVEAHIDQVRQRVETIP